MGRNEPRFNRDQVRCGIELNQESKLAAESTASRIEKRFFHLVRFDNYCCYQLSLVSNTEIAVGSVSGHLCLVAIVAVEPN